MKLDTKPVQIAARTCPVCKCAVAPHHATVSIHGMTFHAYCAGYKRRAGD